jgi:hypothetical protein
MDSVPISWLILVGLKDRLLRLVSAIGPKDTGRCTQGGLKIMGKSRRLWLVMVVRVKLHSGHDRLCAK